MTPRLHDYLVAHGTPPDDVQQALIAETAALGRAAQMQIAPEQGAFMTMLTSVLGARDAIEIGTFTGYSALCIARGLVPGGRLLCCDVNESWTAIGQRHWARAGVADRIELRIGPALETLAALPAAAAFDLAFIDADKPNYQHYFEALLPRIRPGGLILVDNVLWSGLVVDESASDADTVAIRAFNDAVASDPRVEVVMLAIADGLTLIHPRR